MLRKLIKINVLIACFAFTSQAQEWDWATTFNYSIGLPTGDLKEYTDNTSFRGISFEAKKFQTEQISIGFSLGWQIFKNRLEGTFSQTGQDVTGTQVRYVNAFPIMATGHYQFGEPGGVRPYAGVGLGTVHTLQRTDVGLFTVSNNNWHFGFYPEVGVFIPVSFDMGVNVAAKYNYAVAASNSIDYSYLSLSVGLTWLR